MSAIKTWLERGGDVDQGLEQVLHFDAFSYEPGTTLLMAAASMGRLDVVRFLVVDHNADVNLRAGWTAFIFAVEGTHADCIEFLLDYGANTSGLVNETEVIVHSLQNILRSPRVVQMLLAAGLNLTTPRFAYSYIKITLEEYAASCRDYIVANAHADTPDALNRYTETASILEGTRLAGHNYKRWVLREYMELLRVRSMLARGRAHVGTARRTRHAEAVARLFDTSTAAGVPDPCFWLVVEYAWLGNWRRP